MDATTTRNLRLFLLKIILLVSTSWFAATALAGDALDLERYRGKVVVVDFWASWCGPCRQSFPWLNAMQEKYSERGLVVLGVNVDREHGDAERFLREVPAKFPIIYDPAGALAARYDVPGMPSSFVIGPNGEILNRHIGFRLAARAEREAELAKLLSTINAGAALPGGK